MVEESKIRSHIYLYSPFKYIIMEILGIVGTTVYFWLNGARLEISGTFNNSDRADLIEYEGAVVYISYSQMIEAFDKRMNYNQ